MKKTKPRPILIRWRDSYALKDGWCKADYSNTPDPICETVGFYHGSNKTHEIVSLNLSHEKDYGFDSSDTILIPKSCVVKKRYLK